MVHTAPYHTKSVSDRDNNHHTIMTWVESMSKCNQIAPKIGCGLRYTYMMWLCFNRNSLEQQTMHEQRAFNSLSFWQSTHNTHTHNSDTSRKRQIKRDTYQNNRGIPPMCMKVEYQLAIWNVLKIEIARGQIAIEIIRSTNTNQHKEEEEREKKAHTWNRPFQV